MRSFCCALVSVLFAVGLVHAEYPVVGGIENVQIEPGEVTLRAKLDTGADRCSLSAQDIQYFQKGPDLWVKFNLRNRNGDQRAMEMKVLETVKVKREGGRLEKRPVVRFGVCLGSFYMLINASLSDRSDFAYPMLIGRDFITGHLVVDPSRSYVTSPDCAILKKNKKSKRRYEKQH